MKSYFETKISQSYLSEWMQREEGSFEDSSRAGEHVYNILKRHRGKVVANDLQEAQRLLRSADYCCTWNNGDAFSDKADAAIARVGEKLRNSVFTPH